MKAGNKAAKVAADTSLLQIGWSIWGLSISLVIYVILRLFADKFDEAQNFFMFTYHAAKIFMLVMGIVSTSSFLSFYVRQGVTRKHFFIGSAIASAAVSLFIAATVGVVALIERLVVPAGTAESFMGSDAAWLLKVVVFGLNVLVYFMAGLADRGRILPLRRNGPLVYRPRLYSGFRNGPAVGIRTEKSAKAASEPRQPVAVHAHRIVYRHVSAAWRRLMARKSDDENHYRQGPLSLPHNRTWPDGIPSGFPPMLSG